MKATIPPALPTPPRDVTIVLSEEEAAHLVEICGNLTAGPNNPLTQKASAILRTAGLLFRILKTIGIHGEGYVSGRYVYFVGDWK